jgi:hypothetical protein
MCAARGVLVCTYTHKARNDSILRLVITCGVDVANITHLGRGPTAAPADPRQPGGYGLDDE